MRFSKFRWLKVLLKFNKVKWLQIPLTFYEVKWVFGGIFKDTEFNF